MADRKVFVYGDLATEEKIYHVQAETGVDENGNETFHYTEAFALEGFSSDKLMQCIEDGDIEVDMNKVFCKKRKSMHTMLFLQYENIND